MVANSRIYRLVPSPWRFENRQWQPCEKQPLVIFALTRKQWKHGILTTYLPWNQRGMGGLGESQSCGAVKKKSRMTWHLKPSWKIHLSLHKPCGNSIPTLMETAGQQSCSVFNLLKIRLSHDGLYMGVPPSPQPLGIVVMQSSVWQVRKVVSNSQIFRLYWDITCGSIQMHLVLFFCAALQEWHWH